MFFIAAKKSIRAVMAELPGSTSRSRRDPRRRRRTSATARARSGGPLRSRSSSANPEVARRIAEAARPTIVLAGDAADESCCSKNIERTDVFCAVTNDDGLTPVVDARTAPRRPQGHGADQPPGLRRPGRGRHARSTWRSHRSRRRSVLLTHIPPRCRACMRCAAVRPKPSRLSPRRPPDSQVVGRRIDEIRLPPAPTIGAVVRTARSHHLPPRHAAVEPDDHVIYS